MATITNWSDSLHGILTTTDQQQPKVEKYASWYNTYVGKHVKENDTLIFERYCLSSSAIYLADAISDRRDQSLVVLDTTSLSGAAYNSIDYQVIQAFHSGWPYL